MIEKPFIEQIEYIKSLNDCQHSIYDYLRCIWLPELYKQDNLNDTFIPEDNDYMKSVEDLVIRLNMHVIESPEGIVDKGWKLISTTPFSFFLMVIVA